jgi:hypothetical protein
MQAFMNMADIVASIKSNDLNKLNRLHSLTLGEIHSEMHDDGLDIEDSLKEYSTEAERCPTSFQVIGQGNWRLICPFISLHSPDWDKMGITRAHAVIHN